MTAARRLGPFRDGAPSRLPLIPTLPRSHRDRPVTAHQITVLSALALAGPFHATARRSIPVKHLSAGREPGRSPDRRAGSPVGSVATSPVGGGRI
jgi:hypothetical protein